MKSHSTKNIFWSENFYYNSRLVPINLFFFCWNWLIDGEKYFYHPMSAFAFSFVLGHYEKNLIIVIGNSFSFAERLIRISLHFGREESWRVLLLAWQELGSKIPPLIGQPNSQATKNRESKKANLRFLRRDNNVEVIVCYVRSMKSPIPQKHNEKMCE